MLSHWVCLYIKILKIFLKYLLSLIAFCRHETKTLREDAFGNMFIYGSTEIEVRSASEAIDAFNRGQKRRRVAATQVSLGYKFAKKRSYKKYNPIMIETYLIFDYKICLAQSRIIAKSYYIQHSIGQNTSFWRW